MASLQDVNNTVNAMKAVIDEVIGQMQLKQAEQEKIQSHVIDEIKNQQQIQGDTSARLQDLYTKGRSIARRDQLEDQRADGR